MIFRTTVAITLLLIAVSNANAQNIAVHPDQVKQIMTGWEVTGRLWQFDKKNDRFNPEWESHSNQIFDRLVNELGINRFRLEVLSGTENPVDYWRQFVSNEIGYAEMRDHFYEKINDNSDPLVSNADGFQFSYMDYVASKILLPVKKLVESNGEDLFVTLTYVDFKWTTERGELEHAEQANEYAEFILTTFKHLDNQFGIVPDALEVILEADNTLSWNGRNIGLGLNAAKKVLNENGYFPKFIAPSTANAKNALPYFRDMLSVESIPESLDTLAYHRYDNAPLEATTTAIAEEAARQGLQTAMLEHVGADINELFEDLVFGNASAWQQYGIATNLQSNEGGYYYRAELSNPDVPRYYLSETARLFAPIFRHVRSGATRLNTTNDLPLKVAVFRNTDGSYVAAILSELQQQTQLTGLPAGHYVSRGLNKDAIITTTTEFELQEGEAMPLMIRPGLTMVYSGTEASLNQTTFIASSSNTSAKPGGGRTTLLMLLLLIVIGAVHRLRRKN